MAKDKKTILVYADWISIFNKLSDDEAGRLIKHFFAYVNDQNPEAPDRLTDIIFEPIKQTLKRDLRSYKDKCLKNRDNILKRWNTSEYERIKKDTNHSDSDNDSDNDNDKEKNISGKKITKEELLKKREGEFRQRVFECDPLKYSQVMLENFCRYWTEPNKSKTKMRFELQTVFDIPRRLITWASRDKEISKNNGLGQRDNKEAAKHPNREW